MSSSVVLDASAVLCLLMEEDGAEEIADLSRHALISTVNVAEVVGKLRERGMNQEDCDRTLATLNLDVRPLDGELALATGHLRPLTGSQGLSLGDRACLALATATGSVAVTTDRSWSDVTIEGLSVRLVR